MERVVRRPGRFMMAMTASGKKKPKEELRTQEIEALWISAGFYPIVKTIIERAVVAGKREFLIRDVHAEEGAVAGATHEALLQVLPKALGLSIGGKIGLARHGDHVSVAVFCAIGMLHLDEVAVGLGHRAI